MKHMVHHLTDTFKEIIKEERNEGRETLLLGLNNLNRTQKISLLYSHSLRHLQIRVALGDSHESIRDVLQLAAGAIETCFLFATGRTSEAQFIGPNGNTFTVCKTSRFNPAHRTSIVDFINAIYLGMLADSPGLKNLASIEIDALTFSTAKTNPYSSEYANFLRSVLNRDGKAGDWLKNTIKLTFPDQIEFGIPEFIELNDVEHLKVWFALLGGDDVAFNRALENALEAHRAYWSLDKALVRGGQIPRQDTMGYFSLPLTAICKFAHQNGVPIRIRSVYLPQNLIY